MQRIETSHFTRDIKQSYLKRIEDFQVKLADANLENIPSSAKVYDNAMSAVEKLLEKYEGEIRDMPTEAYEFSTETGAALEKQPKSFLEEIRNPKKPLKPVAVKEVEPKTTLLAEVRKEPVLKQAGLEALIKTIHDLYTGFFTERTIDISALETKLALIDQKLSIVPRGGKGKALAEQLLADPTLVDTQKELELIKTYVKSQSSKVVIPVKTVDPQALIREMLDLHTELLQAKQLQKKEAKVLSIPEYDVFKMKLTANKTSLNIAEKEDTSALQKAIKGFANEFAAKGFPLPSLQALQNSSSELLNDMLAYEPLPKFKFAEE